MKPITKVRAPKIPFDLKLERETPLMKRIRFAISTAGGVLCWRNNSGVDLVRGVRYGLGVGSPDLIGIVAPYGRLLGLEVKRARGGVESKEQRAWVDVVRRYGGVTGFVRSVEEALAFVEEARSEPTYR